MQRRKDEPYLKYLTGDTARSELRYRVTLPHASLIIRRLSENVPQEARIAKKRQAPKGLGLMFPRFLPQCCIPKMMNCAVLDVYRAARIPSISGTTSCTPPDKSKIKSPTKAAETLTTTKYLASSILIPRPLDHKHQAQPHSRIPTRQHVLQEPRSPLPNLPQNSPSSSLPLPHQICLQPNHRYPT